MRLFKGLVASVFLSHTLFYFFALGTDAVDDAYISFRYAQNAILGHGLVFNPGERVEGFTNFLWTALMVPLEGARVDVGRVSMVLGALFSLRIVPRPEGIPPKATLRVCHLLHFLRAVLFSERNSVWSSSSGATPKSSRRLFSRFR